MTEQIPRYALAARVALPFEQADQLVRRALQEEGVQLGVADNEELKPLSREVRAHMERVIARVQAG